tara:strand:- start:13213 stop:13887 length:675 start_codon:yes stop_codon:yes gene_type:complete
LFWKNKLPKPKYLSFGYTRTLGELRKLGISRICRQTVKNIVKEAGIEQSPKRCTGTWDQFLKSHAETLWACDFCTKRAVTRRGLVDLYVLDFMHLETREVFATSSTRNPDSAWVTEQTKAFVNHVANRDERPTCLIHDRDTKFSAEFQQFPKLLIITTNIERTAHENIYRPVVLSRRENMRRSESMRSTAKNVSEDWSSRTSGLWHRSIRVQVIFHDQRTRWQK